jgi:hypothetical protein
MYLLLLYVTHDVTQINIIIFISLNIKYLNYKTGAESGHHYSRSPAIYCGAF